MPSAHEREPAVVFSAAGLVVRTAAPTVLLAMKASSMRKIDVRDVVFLAEYLDLHTAPEIIQIHDEWFPVDPLTEAQVAHLDDVETILTVRASPTIPGLDGPLLRARSLREAKPKRRMTVAPPWCRVDLIPWTRRRRTRESDIHTRYSRPG